MRTQQEQLETANANLTLALKLVTELWLDLHKELIVELPTHTEKEVAIRKHLVTTRIAIIDARNDIEFALANSKGN